MTAATKTDFDQAIDILSGITAEIRATHPEVTLDVFRRRSEWIASLNDAQRLLREAAHRFSDHQIWRERVWVQTATTAISAGRQPQALADEILAAFDARFGQHSGAPR